MDWEKYVGTLAGDILKEQSEQGENADEQFDIDFALMSGELAKLLADLMAALGGEKAAAI